MNSEFPSGAPPPEEDYDKMPIEDRLASKVWKARVSAYTTLSAAFARTPSDTDPAFRPYTRDPTLLKGMATDSNAVAQEKGAEAVRAFVEFGGAGAGKTREVVLPALVDKCYGSARAGTKKAAIECTLLYVEMEDVMGSEGPVTDVCNGLSAKLPKLVATCVTVLKEMIQNFGPKQVSPKPILKVLPNIMAHADKTVRAEGSALAVELHRWIGAALGPTIDQLKDIQAKELRALFEEADKAGAGKPSPTRYLISERAKAEAAAATAAAAADGGAEDADDQGGADADAFDFAEPLDAFSHKDWPRELDSMVSSTKWQERKECLEAARKVLSSNPKLKPDHAYDSFVEALVLRITKDVNINVVMEACGCIEAAAKGLRTQGGFGKYRDKVMPPLLEKCKEKKASTVEVLARTLDAVFQTVSISDILEDVFAFSKHKNPNVKTESIRFLVRCLRTTRTPPSKSEIKPIADALVAASGDGSADVREAGFQGLGTLMKLIGERAMTPYMESLDDLKKPKVMEEFAKATVKAKMGGAAPARAPPAAASVPAASKGPPARLLAKKPPAPIGKENITPASADNDTPPPPPPKPVARPAAIKKPPALSSTSAAAKKPAAAAAPAKAGGKGTAAATEPVKFRFPPEAAEERAAELIPKNIQEALASGVWKERLQGAQDFATWLDGEKDTVESEIIVRALAKSPGWKESNFQVLSEVYKILRLLAEGCPTFGRASIALSIQPLCEKLGDIKLKGPAGETLVTYAEKTSFGFVLAQALAPLSALKAPKAIADSLLWIDANLLEFGTSGVDLKSLIEFLLSCLKNSNAVVRTNATKVFGNLARFVGGAVTTFLGDINPQLRTTLEAEVEKAASNPAPAPTRFGAEAQAAASAGGPSGGAGAAAADDALDDLIPRVDLDRLVTSGMIAKLGDANWKERKEACEDIQAILQANQRLKPNLSDLVVPLRQRCADSNISVRTLSLDIIGKIATGMNKGFENHARGFAAPVVQVLADAKAPIRAAATATLSAMAEQVGVAPLVAGMASVLDSKAANPMLKQDLFTWLGEWFGEHPPEKIDLAPLALGAVLCLDDKLAAVRKAAQSVLPFIIASAGYKTVMSHTSGLKAASRNTVVPMIDAANALAAPAAAPAARPKPSAVAALPRATTPSAARAQSPAPVASPRTSIARPGTLKAPGSLTGRTLVKPSAGIPRASSQNSVAESASAVPTFKSRLAGGLKRSTSMAPPAASAAVPAASGSKAPPFLSADPKFKAAREKAFGRGPNWISAEGTARPELVSALAQQCDHHCDPSFMAMLFSKDHNNDRDFLAALFLLNDYISNPAFAEEEYDMSPTETVGRVVANSDLIFKYTAIRFTDNNTSISLKCLDVLGSLFELLQSEQYHMTEYEANCLLPCMISRFGDAKFRDRTREIFRSLTFVFPPSKFLQHLLEDGLPSKNAKVRTECLTEIGHLFSKNGLQVCTPGKVLPVIAKQISDRDASVRTAALLSLGEAYKICSEDIWGFVGKLPPKEMSLLEERLKRTSVPVKANGAAPSTPPRKRIGMLPTSPTSAAPGAGAAPRSSIAGPSKLAKPASMIGAPSGLPSAAGRSRLPGSGMGHVRRESGIAAPGGIARRSASGEGGPAAIPQPRMKSPAAPVATNGHNDGGVEDHFDGEQEDNDPIADLSLDQMINEVHSQDPDRSVAALKQIEREIKETAPQLPDVVDALVVVIGKQVHRSFSQDKDNADLERLRKHLLVTGTSIFDANRLWDDRTLGSFVNRTALIPLLTELLQRMIELSPSKDDTAQMYCKYLNIIVLRSFSACNLNTLLGACLEMLAQATEDMRELGPELLKKRAKFAELVIKCLWKITKRLPDALKQDLIGPQQLLVDVEAFLQAVPPAEWKRRAADQIALQDLPLRTVKVILTHFSQNLKDEALGYVEALPNAENSFVYSYLMRIMSIDDQQGGGGSTDDIIDDVATMDDASMQRSNAGVTRHQSQSSRASLGSTTGENEESINAELRAIFEKISNKNESRQGIRDLYEFQKRYPHRQASIDRSLEATGSIFQRYIRRALANHAAEDGDHAGDLTRDPSRDSAAGSQRDSRITTTSGRSSAYGASEGAPISGLPGHINKRSSIYGDDHGSSNGAYVASDMTPTKSSTSNGSAATSPSRPSATTARMEELRARFRQATNGSSASSRNGSSDLGADS
ncbi:hypothetical protein V8E36_003850 [Tilletia maclaganii]